MHKLVAQSRHVTEINFTMKFAKAIRYIVGRFTKYYQMIIVSAPQCCCPLQTPLS